MISDIRNSYLKSLWKSYPKFNFPENFIFGRFEENSSLSQFQIGEFAAEHFKSHQLVAGNVLVNGDIYVADTKQKALQLLAPCFLPQASRVNPLADRWPHFLNLVRLFFTGKNFNEMTTPTLVESSGSETHLDPFSVVYRFGSQSKTFFLPTSPEFHLKKILAGGYNKIFEIKSCFRNGELTQHHQPEFTMLEWYRAFSNIEVIIKDAVELIHWLNEKLTDAKKFSQQIEIKPMTQLFQEYLHFPLKPNTSLNDLQSLASDLKIPFSGEDTWSDLFFRLFLEKIETKIGLKAPIIVTDFPPAMAALARINESGWADRFEIYWRGLEIANAYDELNDPQENKNRFVQWQKEKQSLAKSTPPIDEELIASLQSGMPPSGGIALGLDRLFMAFFAEENIAKTRHFPLT